MTFYKQGLKLKMKIIKLIFMEEDIKILSEREIEEKLKDLPGWEREGNKIKKQFEFSSFPLGLEFINGLAPFFEEIDHHPDIRISYKKITFELTRYSIGGKLTDRDFQTAREIEKEFAEQ
ncbi:4a-hydroxytetrahydrobiopterin dehydratase [Candidatus Falkowbacteria bacterium]|nr:4a-hydroxytetrahydrobiopterin dehydratase [Candidatus Falkowbacteria bacterium]